MSDASNCDPLNNDPAREASASLRGYWSQIWRSVLVWTQLADTEWLYLEGAEDLDRISGQIAEAVQVKDIAGNVTLRSSGVIEAIDNAWAHRIRNPGRPLKIRFLTTAGIGVEQGGKFLGGIGGLQFWNALRSSGDEAARSAGARQIADFLIADGKVSAPVQRFLRTAADAEIATEIIALIEWDTSAEPAPAVIQEVKDRLVTLGETFGTPPDRAGNVADHLYAYAYEVATRQRDRALNRADLLRQFHQRTAVSIQSATFDRLMAGLPAEIGQRADLPVAAGGQANAVGRPPPVPLRYQPRPNLLADIKARLAVHPILVLQGATGVGKSVAAIGFVQSEPGPWGWVDLRGTDPAAVDGMLKRVAVQLDSETGLSMIVIDDLVLPDDPRPLEAPMARIAAVVQERGGHLVLTSATALPQRIALSLGLPAGATLPVPPFNRDEIASFLIARGCPTAELAAILAAFVELHTSGHAQLVHARVAGLEAQGFPRPDVGELSHIPPEIDQARTEARRLIAALDPPSRELICRLSLTVHALTRRQVFAIAAQTEALAEPGLIFDRLVGPWVETVADGVYRVSPLLRGIASDVHGEGWSPDMHGKIGRAILGFHTLSPTDVSAVLTHAIASRDWTSVTVLAFGLQQSDTDTWAALAESAGWFVLVGTGGAARPDSDPYSLFMMRLLQFRLAVAGGDLDGAQAVIACIDVEMPATTEDEAGMLMRHFFLAQALMRTGIELPLPQLVGIAIEYIQLCDRLAGTLTEIRDPEFSRAIEGPDGRPDMAGVAAFMLSSHLTDRSNLTELLESVEQADASLVKRLLWFIGARETVAQLVFDRITNAEAISGAADWESHLAVLERTYALAGRCGLPGLSQGAARAIVRVIGEDLNRPDDALRAADEMEAAIGPSFGQTDQRAAILLRMGQSDAALRIWRDLLPRWTKRDEFDLQPTFSNRLAAIAAGNVGAWSEAVVWLQSARFLAGPDSLPTYCAGLRIDEGFARWKAGDNDGALECLRDGLQEADVLPPDAANEDARRLRQIAGMVLTWIAHTQSGNPPSRGVEPAPAVCSDLNAKIRPDVPPTPSDASWALLLEFEFAARLGDVLFLEHEARLKASPYGPSRFTFCLLRIQHRLRALALADFVQVVGDWLDAVSIVTRFYNDGLRPSDPMPEGAAIPDRAAADGEAVRALMTNALFALAARGEVTRTSLESWRAGAAEAGLSAIVEPWLDFLIALFVEGTVDGRSAMRDGTQPWPNQIAASIRCVLIPDVAPAELLVAHRLWAGVLSQMKQVFFAVADLEFLVTRAWRQVAADANQRLEEPVAAALTAACNSQRVGWAKVGEVLLAACDSVPGDVPQEFHTHFQSLMISD